MRSPMRGQRRAVLKAALALAMPGAVLAAVAPSARGLRLAAAWDDADGRHWLGLLALEHEAVRVRAAVELPTRAHGLLVEPGGTVLAAARRPGEWLLRWSPRDGGTAWHWIEADRRFNGHLLRAPSGERLYSIETDLESGQGRVALRDARTLARLADWPSHGIDTHQAIVDADGSLLVCNGGVPTRPESGRVKLDLERMDPSLVRLDARSGERLGQWRLDDARLSIRHLARGAGGRIGIALQAEHEEAAERAAAPLLALFDGRRLRSVAGARALAGYGGDVAATASGFAVSAPRAGGVAHWSADGDWLGFAPLAEACALAGAGDSVLAAGRSEAAALVGDDGRRPRLIDGLRLDNHWGVFDTA